MKDERTAAPIKLQPPLHDRLRVFGEKMERERGGRWTYPYSVAFLLDFYEANAPKNGAAKKARRR